MPSGSHLAELNKNRRNNLINLKFNKLTILFEDGKYKKNYTYTCLCDCGIIVNNLIGNEIKRGRKKSCGCDSPLYVLGSNLNLSEYYEHTKKRLILKRTIENECWIWNGIKNNKGYGFIAWGQGSTNRKWVVSRIAYTIWKGEIPDGFFVCHKCDNPRCFNPDHLFIGTQKDNASDAKKKGRIHRPSISKKGYFKLKENDIPIIRELRKSGMKLQEIADIYNVTNANISDICQGHTWRNS